MKLNRMIAALLTVLALCSVSVFANGETEAGSSGSTGQPDSLTLMVDGTFLVKENGESIIEQGFEQLTGIDLIINHPVHNEYYSKVDLAFATGDAPDALILGSKQFVNYAANGALYDLTELYENSDIPARMADPDLVEALRIDGRLYGIPYDRGNGTITYVRQDWLDKLGLDAPTNYAEFLNMLRQFKNNNPDGLAPEDVIPISAAGLVNSEYPMDIYLREFYQDATPDYVRVNGQWVDGMLQPNMVAALNRMRQAYSEGLIDPEIITNKTSTVRDKFYTGRVGVFNYWAGIWNYNLQKNIEANIPDALVRPIPPIEGVQYVERPAVALAISSTADNPEAIFENFFEFAFDGAEGQTLFTFGVEGQTYEVNSDGSYSFLPSIQNPDQPFTKIWFTPTIPTAPLDVEFETASDLIPSSLRLFQANNVAYGLLPASQVLAEYTEEVNAIRANIVSKIVFGEMTVQAGLSQYASDISRYNEVILADLN